LFDGGVAVLAILPLFSPTTHSLPGYVAVLSLRRIEGDDDPYRARGEG
jgi:hypothetical protein